MRDRFFAGLLCALALASAVGTVVGFWIYLNWAMQARTTGWVTTLVIVLVAAFFGGIYATKDFL